MKILFTRQNFQKSELVAASIYNQILDEIELKKTTLYGSH